MSFVHLELANNYAMICSTLDSYLCLSFDLSRVVWIHLMPRISPFLTLIGDSERCILKRTCLDVFVTLSGPIESVYHKCLRKTQARIDLICTNSGEHVNIVNYYRDTVVKRTYFPCNYSLKFGQYCEFPNVFITYLLFRLPSYF